AQKQWGKMLEKVERAKADYHAACKQERSAQNQHRNAGADSSLSPDQLKKLTDRVDKCREDVARCRDKYEQALKEIGENNDRYEQDMSDVFQVPEGGSFLALNFRGLDDGSTEAG
ncbi:protein kinase C and casein kinase substrate in neurons protein 2-like, partial [Tropilaelaps mercedesae]